MGSPAPGVRAAAPPISQQDLLTLIPGTRRADHRAGGSTGCGKENGASCRRCGHKKYGVGSAEHRMLMDLTGGRFSPEFVENCLDAAMKGLGEWAVDQMEARPELATPGARSSLGTSHRLDCVPRKGCDIYINPHTRKIDCLDRGVCEQVVWIWADCLCFGPISTENRPLDLPFCICLDRKLIILMLTIIGIVIVFVAGYLISAGLGWLRQLIRQHGPEILEELIRRGLLPVPIG